MRHEAPNASSHNILSCLPKPPGEVFRYLSQQAGKGAVRPACSRIGQHQGGNQRHSTFTFIGTTSMYCTVPKSQPCTVLYVVENVKGPLTVQVNSPLVVRRQVSVESC